MKYYKKNTIKARVAVVVLFASALIYVAAQSLAATGSLTVNTNPSGSQSRQDSASTATQGDPSMTQTSNIATGESFSFMPSFEIGVVILVFFGMFGFAMMLGLTRFLRNRQLSIAPKMVETPITPAQADNNNPIMYAVEAGSSIAPGMVFGAHSSTPSVNDTDNGPQPGKNS